MRIWARLQLFQAGLVAGCVQAAIVLVMTPVVVLFIQVPDNASGASNPDRAFSVVSLLQLIYVVIAAGVALTTHRYVTSTSARIRRVSRLTSSSEPDRVAGTLAICFLIASFGCASVALQPPPAILMAMNWHLGAHAAGPMLWSALMSLGVAGFGANAHAAVDAYRL